MTTGNAVASTVSVAAVKPGEPPPDCATLDKKNKEERDRVTNELESKDRLTKEQEATYDKAAGTGMTVSSAFSTVPGAEGVFTGCSSGCAQACNPNGMVPGGTSEQKCGDAPLLCDESYEHSAGGSGAHGEAKIVNHMSNMPDTSMRGGALLVSIDWRFSRKSGPKESGMPCSRCYKMLCHAASECDIQIFICDKDKNPQPLSKDDCKSEDGYRNLCQRVDGTVKPGR